MDQEARCSNRELDFDILRRLVFSVKPNGDLVPSEILPHTYQLSLNILSLIKKLDERLLILERENDCGVKKNQEPDQDCDQEDNESEIQNCIGDDQETEDKPIPKLMRSKSMATVKFNRSNSNLALNKKPAERAGASRSENSLGTSTKQELDLAILERKIESDSESKTEKKTLKKNFSMASIGRSRSNSVTADKIKIVNLKEVSSGGPGGSGDEKINNAKTVPSERAREIKEFNRELKEVKQEKPREDERKGVSLNLYL